MKREERKNESMRSREKQKRQRENKKWKMENEIRKIMKEINEWQASKGVHVQYGNR